MALPMASDNARTRFAKLEKAPKILTERQIHVPVDDFGGQLKRPAALNGCVF